MGNNHNFKYAYILLGAEQSQMQTEHNKMLDDDKEHIIKEKHNRSPTT